MMRHTIGNMYKKHYIKTHKATKGFGGACTMKTRWIILLWGN